MLEPRPFVRPPVVAALSLSDLERGQTHRRRVVMTENATGNETLVPVVVVRGLEDGPTLGVTAAVHGNELNGIRVIHHLLEQLGDTPLHRGTLIAVPVANVPGYLRQQREFEDGADLNRIMPGSPTGNESGLYAHRLLDRIIRHFDVLIDLHTASDGRENSLYIRANMENEQVAALARLIAPQIIVHNPSGDGTVRAAAERLGAVALTVEVGDPQRFQGGLVRAAQLGIREVLEHYRMVDDVSNPGDAPVVECSRSYWTRTDRGGILHVLPGLCDRVEKGDVVATLHNVWGDPVREYAAPEAGIVVGRSTNPTARAGSRILHLGIVR